jgi:carbonic anhydrase
MTGHFRCAATAVGRAAVGTIAGEHRINLEFAMTNNVFTVTGPFTRALAGVAALCIGVAAHAAESAASHWSYSGETGPEHWGSEDPAFAVCGTGKHQSPINVERAVVKDLPDLKFDYKDTALKVTDTGHSFQVNAAAGSGGLTVGDDHYDFVQVHFHEPSEERVHGKQYSMVAHIVHKNAKGELAVVAVLIHAGKTNEFLKPIFDNFPATGTAETNVAGKTINMGTFLPMHHGYYTFDGSLTTPPCSENVRWFVLKDTVEASEAQLKQFGARYAHNNRPTQPVNGRVIEETKSD